MNELWTSIMEMGFIDSGSSSPPNPSSFLKFGRKVYFEDAARSTSSTPRRVRASGGGSPNQGGAQPPRCQVEECNVDLTNAKAYYSKHKVCGTHSKTSQVIVGGIKQRFCQQCSRFHQLSEFDQGKRSCRRRLAGHNERRRKPPPGSLFSPHFGRLPSSIFEKRTRSGGFIMDFTRDSWPSAQSNRSTSSKNPPPLLQTSSGTAISSPVECYTGGESATNSSSCALSLLSNQPQLLGSRPNHDMNHPFHGVSLPCVFKGRDVSHEIVPPDLGFQDPGQFLQTLDGHHFSEEVDDLPQQGRRQYYMEEELHYSRSFGSSHHHQMEYRPL